MQSEATIAGWRGEKGIKDGKRAGGGVSRNCRLPHIPAIKEKSPYKKEKKSPTCYLTLGGGSWRGVGHLIAIMWGRLI